jgi:single-strand DNA-binding protein
MDKLRKHPRKRHPREGERDTMNKTILMGRLTRDPEVRPSEKTTIARFSLAVDRRFKREGEADADFFDCTAFGRQAEFVEKYLHQGTKVLVTGRLQNNNYTNKDGQKVYGVQIITEEIEFAESKKAAEEKPKDNGFVNVPDGIEDELPFC